jgi:hypothetical protein
MGNLLIVNYLVSDVNRRFIFIETRHDSKDVCKGLMLMTFFSKLYYISINLCLWNKPFWYQKGEKEVHSFLHLYSNKHGNIHMFMSIKD